MTRTVTTRGEAGLRLFNAMKKAIEAVKTTDEVIEIRDEAVRMAAYARQANDRTTLEDCAEIRVRAERKLGQMIATQRDTVGLATGTRGQARPVTSGSGRLAPGELSENSPGRPTLRQAGIDPNLAHRARRAASIPEENFNQHVAETRTRIGRRTETRNPRSSLSSRTINPNQYAVMTISQLDEKIRQLVEGRKIETLISVAGEMSDPIKEEVSRLLDRSIARLTNLKVALSGERQRTVVQITDGRRR